MEYLNFVKKTYQEAISLNSSISSDLRHALRAHERMPLMFNNLAKELQNVQDLRLRQNKKLIDEKTLKNVVYDFTNIFIAGVEAEAKSRYESDIQRLAAEAEAQKKADLDATASGKTSGDYIDIFEDGEIKMVDDRTEV